MSDFGDDFGGYDDGFGDDGGMGDDAMEDRFDEALPGDDLDDMTVTDYTGADGFTGKDAFFLGSAVGWTFEEGRKEAERRRLMKKGFAYEGQTVSIDSVGAYRAIENQMATMISDDYCGAGR